MNGSAGPLLPAGTGTWSALVTERLRLLLERRAVRLAVVGALMIGATGFSIFIQTQETVAADTTPYADPRWIFVLPVAIAAIAGGLKEGFAIAAISTFINGASTAATTFETGSVNTTEVLIVTWTYFALYGIVAVILGAFAEAHQAVQSSLRQLASTDPLTKVSNIERFFYELALLQSDAGRYAVMVVDLDNLKALNDRYGHQAGSVAIQTVANVLRNVVRATDTVARYGGDEFVVILRQADRGGAQIVANRVRSILSEEQLPHAPDHPLGVSIGIAVSGEDGATAEELLAAADQAMYSDKRTHKERNRERIREAEAAV
jgi:diguanylate cyclase (GGDEF)-like protein